MLFCWRLLLLKCTTNAVRAGLLGQFAVPPNSHWTTWLSFACKPRIRGSCGHLACRVTDGFVVNGQTTDEVRTHASEPVIRVTYLSANPHPKTQLHGGQPSSRHLSFEGWYAGSPSETAGTDGVPLANTTSYVRQSSSTLSGIWSTNSYNCLCPNVTGG
jgi:hypothetical protein